MRIGYLDCFSGLSGDMFLGAAVSAGVPLEKLASVAESLGLGAHLEAKAVERAGISATHMVVTVHGHSEEPLDEPEHTHEHPHGEHSHGEHEHSHEHSHAGHTHPHEHAHVHRGLPEIRQIIAAAPISDEAKAFALRAFGFLAEAEGKIHNRPLDEIHFHEVGSEDAIVDIVCAAVAAEALGVDRWYASALNVGSGTVRCAHGTLPVPAPATAELLKGAPIYSAGPQKELLTPTGAAVLRALGAEFAPMPAAQLTATGYGAGGRDFPGHANVLRLMLGETASASATDSVVVMEANLDDLSPQIVGYAQQKLMEAGALDAFVTPVQMKKGRPGMLLTVLAAPSDEMKLARILFTETTTLGIRRRLEQRHILERRFENVTTPWGAARVKLGLFAGEVVNAAPEFEDCRHLAEASGVPLKQVMQEAMRLFASASGRKPEKSS
ncbi:MAG: nickel pincer cofactor biosynthesis protein LarC [Acidobacteriota bacterium]|nr:nickel pincer cofactor biosynthesis protein LarC [Acidobacteriota bacterium]